MRRPARQWWIRRSLTLRVTAIATVVLAVGLVSGAAGLAAVFSHHRLEAVDAHVRAEEATVGTLVDSGQLPDPLPVPADQPALAQVVDAAGRVLGATPSVSRSVPILPARELKAEPTGHPFTTTQSLLGSAPLRVMVTTARLHGAAVTVVSAVLFTDVRGTLEALVRTLAIGVPILLLAAGLAIWLAVSSALRPVDELRAAADEVADGHGTTAPQLPVPSSGDELARLAETLNRMLARMHAAFEQQTTFVADAAHELRSPIASLRTQLDVALSTPTGLDEWQDVGHDAQLDVERLGRLADDLLLLARIDAGGTDRRNPVEVRELLGVPGDPLWVEADPLALRRAVDNLVSNARRHSRERVAVAAARLGDELVVTVDDDGPGIPAADRERVFERWMRLDDARARDEGGAGLGLAITRSVARSHGGDVTLEESSLGGTRAVFRIKACSPRA